MVTGHTGFKGSWLTIWLDQLGAQVFGISRPPITNPNLYNAAKIDDTSSCHFIDIQNYSDLTNVINSVRPDIIFHLAAQSLVFRGYEAPLETFSTNLLGTLNVLEAMRNTSTVKVAIMVTTDKVYKNREWKWPYRENDELGGEDPYSASKAASEIIIDSYKSSFLSSQGISIASLRAGNVIGGGDWSEKRIFPDAMRSWSANQKLTVRNPESLRPWQHVLEPLAAYIYLVEKLWDEPSFSRAYNIGPDSNQHATVRDVIELARSYYQGSEVDYLNVKTGSIHEAKILALDTSLATHYLDFKSKWTLTSSIEYTVNWYKQFYAGEDAKKLCIEDIKKYEVNCG